MDTGCHQKKRHHYIPIAYLARFTDESDRLFAYRKDDPDSRPLHIKPNNIALERYYYSQPLPNGGRDNNTLEDFFGTFETTWPGIVDRLADRSNLAQDFQALLEFLIVMRVRVPATRDLIELSRAEDVKLVAKVLDRQGQLPPMPPGHEDLLDQMIVSIDPHQSLLAIPSLATGFSKVLSCLEFEVLHNCTDINILTSDNPVVCFNPQVAEVDVLPYQILPPFGAIELLFPISPKVVIRGRTGRSGLRHNLLIDDRPVLRINRFISRFGYRCVFATDRSQEEVIKRYAATSPVPEFLPVRVDNKQGVWSRWVFGPRPMKPKWVEPTLTDAA